MQYYFHIPIFPTAVGQRSEVRAPRQKRKLGEVFDDGNGALKLKREV